MVSSFFSVRPGPPKRNLPPTAQMASNIKRTMMHPDDRRKALLAEPDIEIVEEYRVFCRPCKKWIVMDRRAPYKYHRWKEHMTTEGHLGTSKATSHWERTHPTTDQRRQILLDDPHAAEVEEHQVLCGPCNEWISLEGRPAYRLFSWRIHKLMSNHMNRLSQRQIQDTLSGSKQLHSNRSCSDRRSLCSGDSSSSYAPSPNLAREDIILPPPRTQPSQHPGLFIDPNDSAVGQPDGDPDLDRISEPVPQPLSENLYADIVDYLKSHLTQSDDELRTTALAMQELIRLGVLEPLE